MSKKMQRLCMGCNAKKDKIDLIRIVKNKQNVITIDKTGKAQGRGAYICNDMKCLEKLIKNNKLQRALRTNISEDIYDSLRGVIVDK